MNQRANTGKKRPTILIAQCSQEISSFNPVPSRYDDFLVSRGKDLLDNHRGKSSEVGGAIAVFEDFGCHLASAYGARSITSGGILAKKDFDRLAKELLTSVADAVHDHQPDGVYLALHGAMCADGNEDPEGYLIEEVRRIVGPVPIVISLDLHGIITKRMLQFADGVVSYRTYPHVDFEETGIRAAKLLLKFIGNGIEPFIVRVYIPALVRGDELKTDTGVLGSLMGQARTLEEGDEFLAAGILIGNPFTDVPELGSDVILVADGNEEPARRLAVEIASAFWEQRLQMQANLVSLEDAVKTTVDTHEGTVILVDAADATSSGASGDSTVIAAALHHSGYRRSVLTPVVDPLAVEMAESAGVGNRVRLTVGGAMDKRFAPLDVDAEVQMLSDGRIASESHGAWWNAGRTAVLRAGNMTFVVTSRPVSLYDRSLFLSHGIDPKKFDAVVVKSPHCQPQFYEEWCARLLNVDAPGATSANLPTLGHVRCHRPIFPLEPNCSFEPEVEIYRSLNAPRNGRH